jgi:hypothetical protein
MDRSNHYEAAFEGYLQWHRLCYVAVDETRRCFWEGRPIKSLDFVVYGPDRAGLLVDVKGRRFPGGPSERPRFVWESWSTEEDIHGLGQWCRVFGPGYLGLLLFMYCLGGETVRIGPEEELWTWQGRRYVLRAIPVTEYVQRMRQRSPRWQTVYLSAQDTRELARPFRSFWKQSSPCTSKAEVPL